MRRHRQQRKTGKKFDGTNFAAYLEQLGFFRGFWCALGIVSKDGDTHFEIDAGEDVVVEVELQPSKERVSCRLAGFAAGAGAGLWKIPPNGTEVLVGFPEGDVEFQPVIVACYSTGSLPSGVTEDDTVLVNNTGDLKFDATTGDVVVAAGGEVKLGSDSAAQSVVKGDSYASAEKTFVDAFTAWRAALLTMLGGLDGFHGSALIGAFTTADTVLTAAATAFKSSVDASLSLKTKTD